MPSKARATKKIIILYHSTLIIFLNFTTEAEICLLKLVGLALDRPNTRHFASIFQFSSVLYFSSVTTVAL